MNYLFDRMLFAGIDAAASGDANAVIAAVSGKAIRVMCYTVVAAADVTVTWKSGSTAISGAMDLPAKGGASPASPLGMMQTAEGAALNLTLSGAVQVSGHVGYILI